MRIFRSQTLYDKSVAKKRYKVALTNKDFNGQLIRIRSFFRVYFSQNLYISQNFYYEFHMLQQNLKVNIPQPSAEGQKVKRGHKVLRKKSAVRIKFPTCSTTKIEFHEEFLTNVANHPECRTYQKYFFSTMISCSRK